MSRFCELLRYAGPGMDEEEDRVAKFVAGLHDLIQMGIFAGAQAEGSTLLGVVDAARGYEQLLIRQGVDLRSKRARTQG